MGLEGIVSKNLGSFYKPGQRTADWLKVKVWRIYEVEMVGVELDAAGSRVSSVLIGDRLYDGTFSYAGRVEIGLPRLDQLVENLKCSGVKPLWPHLGSRRRFWLPEPTVKVRAIHRRPGESLRHATLVR